MAHLVYSSVVTPLGLVGMLCAPHFAQSSIKKRERMTAMMERLKQLTRGMTKGFEPLSKAPVPEQTPQKKFCDPNSKKPCITVCKPREGCEHDCEAVRNALKEEIDRHGLSISIGDAKVGCGGRCQNGPFIGFPQREFFYLNVRPEDIPMVVEETLMKGRILFPFLSIDPNRSYRPDVYYEKETGLIAGIDEHVCMVEVAKYFLDFEEGLSCGKCVPCRLGMKRMHETLGRIVSGQGKEGDLELIRSLCDTMVHTPHCEFAVTSSRPVLSAMQHFENEFRAHVERQECPAGVCQELVALQKKRARRRKK